MKSQNVELEGNMRLLYLSILLYLFFSCQEKNTEEFKQIHLKKPVVKKQTQTIESKNAKVFDPINIFPKDTIIKQWHLNFNQISISEYKTLSKDRITTHFKQDDTKDFLVKKDSCYHLTFTSHKKDTLCSFNDGEYYENYTLSGFSKKTNTILFDWNNWEEAHSILINLNQDKYWILCSEHEVSPNNRKLVTFSNYIDNPIYEKNEFYLYELREYNVAPIYHFSNQKYGIFETQWLNDDSLLILLKEIDSENYQGKTSYYFNLRIIGGN